MSCFNDFIACTNENPVLVDEFNLFSSFFMAIFPICHCLKSILLHWSMYSLSQEVIGHMNEWHFRESKLLKPFWLQLIYWKPTNKKKLQVITCLRYYMARESKRKGKVTACLTWKLQSDLYCPEIDGDNEIIIGNYTHPWKLSQTSLYFTIWKLCSLIRRRGRISRASGSHQYPTMLAVWLGILTFNLLSMRWNKG